MVCTPSPSHPPIHLSSKTSHCHELKPCDAHQNGLQRISPKLSTEAKKKQWIVMEMVNMVPLVAMTVMVTVTVGGNLMVLVYL